MRPFVVTPAPAATSRSRPRTSCSRPWPVLDVPRVRTFETGGNEMLAAREQWDDGNNVLAVAPGVVVAYERGSTPTSACATTRSRS